jgi:Na+/proline symporter
MMALVDNLIIIGYFVITIIAGVYFSKYASKGITDYFLGGRNIPWWALGMSGTASNFDMTGTMVITSFLFAIGLQGFWVSMRGGLGLPLGIMMVMMGKWLRRSNVMTNAEWMEFRFGKEKDGQAARLLSAVSNLVVTIAFLIYFVKGTGKFLSVFLPFSAATCSFIMVGFALFYTTLSGLYGVICTDVFQEIMILIVSIFIGIKAFAMPDHAQVLASAGDAWNSFVPQWTAGAMNWLSDPFIYRLFGLCIIFWVARGIFEGAGGFTGGYMTQRYYSAKNDREAGIMTAEWIILLFFRWALIIGAAFLGLALARDHASIARILASDPEKTIPVVIGYALPAGLRGLIVAGLIAAAMSTFDSTINAGAAYWVRDIYQRFLHPQATNKQLIRQSYLSTVILALISVALALAIHNIDEIWRWITGPLSAGLFAPIILRWYWWRFNGWGFAISTATGLIVSIFIKVINPDMPLYISFPITWMFSVVGGVAGALLTPATDTNVLKDFWEKIKPLGFWGKISRENNVLTNRSVSRENHIDVLTSFFAIMWHVTGVCTVISLILHKWATMSITLACFAVLSGLMYVLWYRRLQPREKAARQLSEDTSVMRLSGAEM